jgi:hypothetical protein
MRVYSGSSSSGEMNSVKEETYRISHSLGAASNSWVIANVDHHTVGLLLNQSAASFANACAGLFLAPEVERDLLKVPNLSLIEAVNFHAASVNGRVFTYIHFVALFLPGGSFMWRI